MTSESLKAWRVERGLTQKQLAEMLSVAIQTICAWENGRRGISPLVPLALEGIEAQETAEK